MFIQQEKPPTSIEQEEEPSPAPSQLYSHTFFSREASTARKALVPALFLPIVYNVVLLWACLSLFFGSLLKSNDISRISVTAVNLDDGPFGSGLISGIENSLDGPDSGFRWDFANVVGDGDAWSRNMVVEERTWAVLQISANASSNLRDALQRGDVSYDPLSAITLYFASARNQVTTLAVMLPTLMGLTNGIVSQLAVNSTATFLSTNQDRLPLAALQCPQCLVTPYAVKQVDLIPFNSAAAFGTLNTGLIFLLTFTFNIFTILRAGAELHGHILNLRSTLTFRALSSLGAYIFLSLMYTLGILAFQIPLTGHYNSTGAGFMALWMLNWCTMGACGLAMESVFTLIGMQWAPFFLNIWLISNASGSFASPETMPGFYQYGYAMPFYQCIQATRTIVFGTKSHLGVNFGVLVAWMAVSWCGICGFTWWRMKTGRKSGVHRVP